MADAATATVLCPFCRGREGTIDARDGGRAIRVCPECLAVACLSPAEKRKRLERLNAQRSAVAERAEAMRKRLETQL